MREITLTVGLVCGFVIAGCPELPGEGAAPGTVGTSDIPEGIYVGEATITMEVLVNGRSQEVVQGTEQHIVVFGSDGLPSEDGRPVQPGDRKTEDVGSGFTVSIVVDRVEASGNRVAIWYSGTATYLNGSSGPYGGTDVYDYFGDGTVREVEDVWLSIGTPATGGVVSAAIHSEATLTSSTQSSDTSKVRSAPGNWVRLRDSAR